MKGEMGAGETKQKGVLAKIAATMGALGFEGMIWGLSDKFTRLYVDIQQLCTSLQTCILSISGILSISKDGKNEIDILLEPLVRLGWRGVGGCLSYQYINYFWYSAADANFLRHGRIDKMQTTGAAAPSLSQFFFPYCTV